ncbi:type VI secretion system lipoprotein TssJ [Pantoea phytobeneficialis]|uniref:Type VI secretion system lipoprotein TssJ n=1 Tax=Pantoea phytobeneficialis TaxID=2052056 RepID=A0AAP9KQT0_9GAMM|nr:type VI secretion system lipoprotein TssJ [Pantoea phytobeneficialis]MDO6410082.1 type VI secretion system lipoprotein TssJ [Pantoea phytobeneficialis]QGR08127.1 type VI secretion system lipoprotein TssJ [Pantoea phytobeneficialis]
MSSTILRNLVLCTAALNLTACGLQQNIVDSTASTFNAMFYKQIKILHLDFSARESLNSDIREHHPLSEPVMVRVYQLKARKTFDSTVYQQLIHEAAEVLHPDLLAERDVIVTPGGDVALNMPMESETRFVAIVGLFQHPDMARNSWRLVLERNDLDPDTPRVIELDSRHLLLRAEAKS